MADTVWQPVAERVITHLEMAEAAYHTESAGQGSSRNQPGLLRRIRAMVASDGPHYGANVKLDGPGKYQLRYHIDPPPYQDFYRHKDKETGVGKWWAPFVPEWEFAYVGTGKKGGY